MQTGRQPQAVADFQRARQQAAIKSALARLTGKSIDLLSFDSVVRGLKPTGQAERGLQDIPLEAIAGSVGRTHDFTRDFLPRHDTDEERWARVRTLAASPHGVGLPPIQVYQIGQAYFVIDGHHRVSVARQLGATHISAYVTEVRTRVPLSADVSPEELIVKAEYADFLERTELDRRRPHADLSVSEPGATRRLAEHIETYQQALTRDADSPLQLPDAATRWYDEVYLPVVQVIREHGLPRDFPNHTEADLYLLLVEHRTALEASLGWSIKPETGANHLAANRGARRDAAIVRAGQRLLSAALPDELKDGPVAGTWRQSRLAARYSDRLFADILVGISGTSAGWQALDQALLFAERERADLHGLHVVPSENRRASAEVRAIGAEFDARCHAGGRAGRLAVEVGDIARQICARAAVVDLVVVSLKHPPAAQPLARLGSGLRTLLRRCPRPVLVVPQARVPIERVLLAYDGSPKAEEALFVAAYLAEAWKVGLFVVGVHESDRVVEAHAHARSYLDMHEVSARFEMYPAGSVAQTVVQAADTHDCQLVLIGGYGARPMVEAVVGSEVDEILRTSRRPLLICR